MEVISGPRGSGKTTELIRVANENNARLVCHTKERCKQVVESDMYPELDKRPISYNDVINGKIRGTQDSIVIDDMEFFINHFVSTEINGFAITADETTELTS
ncbi:hypothetical protein HAPG_00042 [Halorubrum phage GNf2]|nr:hypothetical protein HAPG_00042 [Halorubrum phage GNf2]